MWAPVAPPVTRAPFSLLPPLLPPAPAPLQADTYNHLIRRIDLSSGLVSTLAGTSGSVGSANGLGTVARFDQPVGVAMDNAGTVALVVSGACEGVGDDGELSRPHMIRMNGRLDE